MNKIKDTALALLEQGISIIPVGDGSQFGVAAKQPLCKWAEFQEAPMTALQFNKISTKAFAIAPTPLDGIECIDFDKKNYPPDLMVHDHFIQQVQEKRPELAKRLYIEETPGGGVHIVYKCPGITYKSANKAENKREQWRGVAYASRYEQDKDRVLELAMIETRVYKGYFVVAPSDFGEAGNYKVLQGNILDLPTISKDDRKFLLDLAESYDRKKEREEQEQEVKSSQAVKAYDKSKHRTTGTVPDEVKSFEIFNDSHDALEILLSMGFEQVQVFTDRISVRRPGRTTSKHSGYYFPESNCVYIFSTNAGLPVDRTLSPADLFLIKNNIDIDSTKAALNFLRSQGFGVDPRDLPAPEEETEQGHKFKKFWWLSQKNGIPVINLNRQQLQQFLEDEGFRRLVIEEGAPAEYKYIHKGVIHNVTDDDIHRYVVKFFNDFGTMVDEIEGRKVSKVTMQHFLMGKELDIKRAAKQIKRLEENRILKPTIDRAYIFFKNVAVKITKDGMKLFDYEQLPGLIWKAQIIKHEYNGATSGGAWEQFIRNCVAFHENYDTLRAATGYLLHDYHKGTRKAIVLTDRFSSSEEANGRTGKSLYAMGLQKMVSTTNIPAKNWSPEKNFAFQSMKYSDSLLILNDLDHGFKFEGLYNIVTDKVIVEKKGQQSFELEVKLLVTTNYLFKVDGSSSEQRLLEIEFGSHYNEHHTPFDDFGFLFFNETMPQKEWDSFFYYCMACIRFYLTQLNNNVKEGGLIAAKIISQEHQNKKVEAELGLEFCDFMRDNFDFELGFAYDGQVTNYPVAYRRGYEIGSDAGEAIFSAYRTRPIWERFKENFKQSRMTETKFIRNLKSWFNHFGIDAESSVRLRIPDGLSDKQVRVLMVAIPEQQNWTRERYAQEFDDLVFKQKGMNFSNN